MEPGSVGESIIDVDDPNLEENMVEFEVELCDGIITIALI